MIEQNKLREYLIDVCDYPISQVEDTLKMVELMTPRGHQALNHLMTTGGLPQISYSGLSLTEMKRQKPEMSDVAQLIVFDQLLARIAKDYVL